MAADGLPAPRAERNRKKREWFASIMPCRSPTTKTGVCGAFLGQSANPGGGDGHVGGLLAAICLLVSACFQRNGSVMNFFLSAAVGLAFLFVVLWFVVKNAETDVEDRPGGAAMAGALFEFFDEDRRKALEVVIERAAGEMLEESANSEPVPEAEPSENAARSQEE